MAIPVLLILAVLWAAVLVPPVLRSRTESRRGEIGDFTSRLGALAGRHSSPRSTGSRPGRSLHAAPSPRNGGRPTGSAGEPVASEGPAPTTPPQKRRRDVLIVLGGAAVATLLLAVIAGNPLLWVLHGLADVMLGAFVVLIVSLKRQGSLAPSTGDAPWLPAGPPRPSLAHPRVPARPELAPLPQAVSPLPRTAAR